MRYLIITRGLPGSGKSTFLAQKELEAYTLSLDTIRLQYQGPSLNIESKLFIPQDNEKHVWETLNNHLETRMRLGELIFVDAAHIKSRDFQKYEHLIKNYRYRALCLDFTIVDLNICKERNRNGTAYKIVPEYVLDEMWADIQTEKLPSFMENINPNDLDKILSFQPIDFSNYKKIHHFGDIQGCFKPLNQYFEQNPIQDDELYIFVGDYCDRGRENHLVIEFMLKNYQRPNFISIEGNHEAHLWKWACGLKSKLDEFEFGTKPQLEAACISQKEVRQFCEKMQNLAYYTFNEKTVVVTHGGVSNLPANLIYIKSNQFIRGVGLYEQVDLVDGAFNNSTKPETYQIHGHRNIQKLPTRVNSKCFNLEGKVEFGGHLRIVTLDSENGFEIVEVHNPSI